jgi:eukaryotic-like serine/threonine-protein kinase
MSTHPPTPLVELLERLGLATSRQILQAGRTLRWTPGELRQFDSVWVDALVRAKRLTPFQAHEINAGRGEELQIGPYLLCEKIAGPPYVESYRAKNRETGAMVRLCIESRTGFQPVSEKRQVRNLSYRASPWIEGRTAGQWLIVNGRFPPEIVREIARSMFAELAALEKSGSCHGDIAPWNLLITLSGESILLNSGLRATLRPVEGFAFADLLPEAYDYLAPERVVAGAKPNISSDIYACGCVLWHLLCGRPPLRGGDSLAKLRAAAAAEIPDVRQFAPETPAMLAETISTCVQKNPGRRGESVAKLAATLGPPTNEGRQFVARTLASTSRTRRLGNNRLREKIRSQNWPVRLTVIVGCIAVVLLLLGPVFQGLMEKTQRRTGLQPVGSSQRRTGFQPVVTPKKSISNETKTRQVGNLSYMKRDPQVQPAGYNSPEKPRLPKHSAVQDYLVDADAPQFFEMLSLERGQRIIGKSGRRAILLVPPSGLKIEGDEIRLENLDFLWDTNNSALSSPHSSGESLKNKVESHPSAENAAIILFSGSRAEFRGCRFFAAKETSVRPAVIRWLENRREPSEIALSNGRLQFTNCIFERVGECSAARRRGATALDLKSCLLLETGGLLRLDHQPDLDEPISLHLAQLTMHKTGPLLNCQCSTSENPPGEIAVEAENCVFSPRKNVPLLAFEGLEPPQSLLRNIRWTGSGSLVEADTAVGAWKPPSSRWEPLDDTPLSIAGLVRSRLEFAEDAENDENPVPSGLLLHWQAPLPTADPPGIDAESLPRGAK